MMNALPLPLLQHLLAVLRPRRGGRRLGRRAPRPLAVEALEDRRLLSTLQAISLPSPGQPPSDTAAGVSVLPAVSGDGRYVAFESTANNLVPGQTGTGSNVFLLDRRTGSVTLVSHLPGAPTTGSSVLLTAPSQPLLSGDGRYVVYVAGNDVLGQGQSGTSTTSVLVYDRTTDQNTLVSHTTASPPAPILDSARLDAVSSDGNYIAFDTGDADLVPNEQSSSNYDNLYLYDQAAQATFLVTHEQGSPNVAAGFGGTRSGPSVAVADDGTVAFGDADPSGLLLPGDTGSSGVNVYLYTPSSQANQLVSAVSGSPATAAGQGGSPVISADGSTVVYVSSATDLVPGQAGPAVNNVFRYSVATGTTTLVSGSDGSPTTGGDGDSGALGLYTYGVGTYAVAVTPDGRFIAFVSQALDLVDGQSGAAGNVFLYDSQSGSLTLLSGVNGSSTVAAGGDATLLPSNAPFLPTEDPISQSDATQALSISDDGSLVAFVSQASNLAAGETGPSGNDNLFLYSRASGQTSLVTGIGGSATATDAGQSGFPVLSGDGSSLAFHSLAVDLAGNVFDANGVADVFTYSTASRAVTVVSRAAFVQAAPGNSYATSASADGRYTVLTSTAEDLVSNQVTVNGNQNVFLRDNLLGTVALVNHLPGLPDTTGDGGIPFTFGQRPYPTQAPVISADGSTIAFVSADDNLVAGTPTGSAQFATPFLYLYDVQSGQVRLVDPDSGFGTPEGGASQPALSASGRYVAYALVGGEIVLYDSVADTTTVLATGMLGVGGSDPSISGDGRFVAYQYTQDLFFTTDVYVYDSTSKTETLVSHAAGSAADAGNADSTSPVISQDGSTIAFVSAANDLVSGQADSSFTNVFVYKNDGSGAVSLVSGVNGSTTVGGDGNSDSPVVDGDGSYVAYRSDADNLVSGPVSGSNVYEYNTATGTQTLVSHHAGAATTAADGGSSGPVIDGDGHLVSYVSTANDLVAGQSGPAGVENVYLWLRQTDANILASGQDGSPTVTGDADSTGPLLTDAAFPAFSSTATNLVPGVGGTSVAYLNTLVRLVLSANVVPAGSAPGTVVGTLSVDSPYAGQLLPPTYALPVGAYDDNVFNLGATLGGTVPLLLEVPAGYAGRQSYQVSVRYDAGLGNDFALLQVAVAPSPGGGNGGNGGGGAGGAITARLVPVRFRRKTRLMVEIFDASTGALEMTFDAPFQRAGFRNLRVNVLGGNQVVVTARRGRRTVTATYPA